MSRFEEAVDFRELDSDPSTPASAIVRVYSKAGRFFVKEASGNVYPVSTTTPNTQSGTSYTIALSDAFRLVELTNSGSITLTIPTNASVAFPLGTVVQVVRLGGGSLTVSSAATLRDPTSRVGNSARYEVLTLIKRDTDEWLIYGDGATKSVGHTFGGGPPPGTPNSDEITIFTQYDILYYIDDSGASRPVSSESVRTESSTSYTLALSDNGYTILLSGTSPTVTIPANSTVAFPIGSEINLIPRSGTSTISATGGVTLRDPSSRAVLGTHGNHSLLRLVKVDTDEWLLDGDGTVIQPIVKMNNRSSRPSTPNVGGTLLYSEELESGTGNRLLAYDTGNGYHIPPGYYYRKDVSNSTYTLSVTQDIFREITFSNAAGTVVSVPSTLTGLFWGAEFFLTNRSDYCTVRITLPSGHTWLYPYLDDEVGPHESVRLQWYNATNWILHRPMSTGLATMISVAPTHIGA